MDAHYCEKKIVVWKHLQGAQNVDVHWCEKKIMAKQVFARQRESSETKG